MKTFAILAMSGLASAHLDAVCSCTDSAVPGTVGFYFATYHGMPNSASVPGQVVIKAPSGQTSSFSFSTFKAGLNRSNQNGALMTQDVKSSWGLAATATCSCYGGNVATTITENGAQQTATKGITMQPSTTNNACSPGATTTWYKAELNGATSGTYIMHTVGTDMNLAPYGSASTVCGFTAARKLVLDLSISDGMAGCTGAAAAVANSNGTPASCQNVASGSICPMTCKSGFYAGGETVCKNGAWVNSFSCGSGRVCAASGITSTGIAFAGGVTGDGCGFTSANGVTCTLSCTNGKMAAPASASVTCDNGSWTLNTAGATCVDAPPTPPPTPRSTATNGGWGSWPSANSATCSASCGAGTKTLTRPCDSPAPANGGAPCSGAATKQVACNHGNCPVHCATTAFDAWTACTKSCGKGSQSRSRTVTTQNLHGGYVCPYLKETRNCNESPCPINGGWSQWSSWSVCDKTCDTGVHARTRACNTPAPVNGGNDCSGIDGGENTEDRPCNTHTCFCPKCKYEGGRMTVFHLSLHTEHKGRVHGPRAVHTKCAGGSKTGACTKSYVMAHSCHYNSKTGCKCVCKKPTEQQTRDHHEIAEDTNANGADKEDLTNYKRSNPTRSDAPWHRRGAGERTPSN
jgi:hypothetical protein